MNSPLTNNTSANEQAMMSSLSMLRSLDANYLLVHGPLSLVVCIVGVTMNFFNIAVLAHKEMVSPINRLLQAIAVADLLTMFSYIPYSLLFYIIHGVTSSAQRNSFPATAYVKFHAIFAMICHTASIWLTVSVALFRYIYLSTKSGRQACTLTKSHIAIAVVTVFSVSVNFLQAFLLKIEKWTDPTTNSTWYYLDTTGIKTHREKVIKMQYIMAAVLLKIGPCVLLIILSALLVKFLLQTQTRYMLMKQKGSSSSAAYCNSDKKRQQQTNQTTKLLVAVVIVFTLSELPQGVCYVLSGLGKQYEEMFWLLGNMFDLLTIISCAVNFFLYCGMSAQFRKIFLKLLRMQHIKVKVRRCCSENAQKEHKVSTTTKSIILMDIGQGQSND